MPRSTLRGAADVVAAAHDPVRELFSDVGDLWISPARQSLRLGVSTKLGNIAVHVE